MNKQTLTSSSVLTSVFPTRSQAFEYARVVADELSQRRALAMVQIASRLDHLARALPRPYQGNIPYFAMAMASGKQLNGRGTAAETARAFLDVWAAWHEAVLLQPPASGYSEGMGLVVFAQVCEEEANRAEG